MVSETEDDSELRFLDMPAQVRWYTPDGSPIGSAHLPEYPSGVFVMRDGVLVETDNFMSESFFGADGQMRWEHPGKNHGGTAKGEWFVLLSASEPIQQILIEPLTGTKRIAATGSPYVIGAVPGGETARLLTTRNNSEEIIAVRP